LYYQIYFHVHPGGSSPYVKNSKGILVKVNNSVPASS
jgi:hypothetical protein